jgi:Cytochrome C oxidase, cbb3-type, subunit III
MSRIHLKSNSLVLCLSLAAAVAGAAGVSCSSSDDTTASSAAGSSGKPSTGTAGTSAGGDTSAAGEASTGEAGESAGGSAPTGDGEEAGAAGAPMAVGGSSAGGSSAGGSSAGGSSGDDMAASIARGKAITDAQSCVACHGSAYAGAGFYPNITPDEDTGIGLWTTDQIKAAITMGKRNDGTSLCMSMQRFTFTATEVTDVVNFLTNLPAVSKKITDKCPG